MKHAKRLSIATFVGGAMLSVLSFGPALSAEFNLGVLFLDSHGFFGGIQKGIVEGAGDADVSLITSNSEADPVKEAEFLDTAIGAGVDAVIMSPVSVEASVTAIERVVEAGIPVICYNTCLSDEDTERLAGGLVTTNQFDFGKDIGVVAAGHVKASGQPARVGILNCDRFEACQQRKAGFIAALDGAEVDYTIAADQEGFIADAATQTGTEMLTANPDINLIWTANEGGTIGAVLAVQAAGLVGDTFVFGSDITAQIAQMLEDADILKAIIAQQPQLMGREAVVMALAIINGEAISDKLMHISAEVIQASDPGAIANWKETHADGIP
jgi:ABC-type sugar transport system substrate-binding protein